MYQHTFEVLVHSILTMAVAQLPEPITVTSAACNPVINLPFDYNKGNKKAVGDNPAASDNK